MKRVRYALDAAVVWLFFFIGWSAFYLANQAQAEALGAAAPAGGRRERGPGRAGPGAALPGQSALPVQHAEFAVVAGDDRPHATAPRRCCSRFRPSSAPASRSIPSADVSLAEEIDLQRLYLDIEKARFPDRLHCRDRRARRAASRRACRR